MRVVLPWDGVQRIAAAACAHPSNIQENWSERFRKGRVSRGETRGGAGFLISSGVLNI